MTEEEGIDVNGCVRRLHIFPKPDRPAMDHALFHLSELPLSSVVRYQALGT
jgi:hypothetical protein